MAYLKFTILLSFMLILDKEVRYKVPNSAGKEGAGIHFLLND